MNTKKRESPQDKTLSMITMLQFSLN